MPAVYAEMQEEEMMYLDGGMVTTSQIVKQMFSTGGGLHSRLSRIGNQIGWMDTKQRVLEWYDNAKGPLRTAVEGIFGVRIGSSLMAGFERGLYGVLNIR
ncbi:MAG: hypothetical protein ACRC6X_02060 [Culicoidibacterales bacterium]